MTTLYDKGARTLIRGATVITPNALRSLDRLRAPIGVVQGQPAAQGHAHEGRLGQAQARHDVVEPQGVGVAVQRRARGRAETRLADHVHGVAAEVLRPQHGVEHPGGGVRLRTVQQDQRRQRRLAPGDHEGLALAGRQPPFLLRPGRAVQHLAIEGADGVGAGLRAVDRRAHRRLSSCARSICSHPAASSGSAISTALSVSVRGS